MPRFMLVTLYSRFCGAAARGLRGFGANMVGYGPSLLQLRHRLRTMTLITKVAA